MKNILKKCLFVLSLMMPVASAAAQTITFKNDLPNCSSILNSLFTDLGHFENARIFINDLEVPTNGSKDITTRDGVCNVTISVNAAVIADLNKADEIAKKKISIPLAFSNFELPVGKLAIDYARSQKYTARIHFECKLEDGMHELSLCDVINRIRIKQKFNQLDVNLKYAALAFFTYNANMYLSEKTK